MSIPFEALPDRVQEIVNSDRPRDNKLEDICRLLREHVDSYDWVGFYFVDPDVDRELVLGPYVGEETDHTRIPFGTGICGQAADIKETFIVGDVDQETNYLACSPDVKSEIVVPLMKDGELLGELDIDSHKRNGVDDNDRVVLEKICEHVARLF